MNELIINIKIKAEAAQFHILWYMINSNLD